MRARHYQKYFIQRKWVFSFIKMKLTTKEKSIFISSLIFLGGFATGYFFILRMLFLIGLGILALALVLKFTENAFKQYKDLEVK